MRKLVRFLKFGKNILNPIIILVIFKRKRPACSENKLYNNNPEMPVLFQKSSRRQLQIINK
jgi:hypothetical protein